MITTSANYKTAIKAVSREIRAYLKFNGSTIYRGVDGLVSINWNAQLFDKERFCVNCANAAFIEAEMYGEPIQNLESAYVEAYIGVVLEYKATKPSGSIEEDTADVEYVKIGRFDVTEVVRKNGKVMISAYDRMAKLSENYVTTVTPTADGYSKSAIVTDIKNQCGLTWTQSFSGYVPEIVNSTMRDQLCWLYGSTTSTGQSLMLSRDGTTVISKVIVGQTALNYTIDDSTTYLDGLNDQPSFTITSYTANAGENTYSYGSGAGVECYNPYISSTTAGNTYNFIKNFSYTPMTLEFRGDPAIELGDILTVTSGNNSYSVVVMKMATVFNGGLKTTIYCYGNTEEWDAISNSPTGARIIQTENMVRIEASRASEAEGELRSSITTNANNITLAVANTPVVNLLPSVYYRENESGKTWVKNDVTWAVNNDGSVTATGTASATTDYYLTGDVADANIPWVTVDPTKKHIISATPGVTGCRIFARWYNSSGTYVSAAEIQYDTFYVIPAGAKYIVMGLRVMSGTSLPVGGVTFYPMLEVGDTAHSYVSTHNGSYAMESEIKQNAHDITLKVSETDVTGNYVIGKINLNSTTATIAAEHINLQGAVSISSFNSATQAALVTNTAVKNQYYISTSSSSATGGTWADTTAAWSSGKYVWTRVVTTKTYADGTSTTTNGTAVYDANLTSALETGAANTANMPIVNLLPSVYYRESESGKTWGNNGVTWTVNEDGSITATGTATANSTYVISGSTLSASVPGILIDNTKKYYLSGCPSSGGSTTYYLEVRLFNEDGTGGGYYPDYGSGRSISPISTSKYMQCYAAVISGYAIPTGGITFYPMLEVGDAAHAYVSTHNGSSAIMAAAVASTVSCYYRSTTSTTPTISTSTSIGTAVDTSNAWEYVMPRPKNGCYFFTCERYVHGDGSVTFSTVRQLANATYTSLWCSSADSTYIDGGQIYTGTVNANAIKANETFTQTLYAQDFRITGGSINITTNVASLNVISLSSDVNGYIQSMTYAPESIQGTANQRSTLYISGTNGEFYSFGTSTDVVRGFFALNGDNNSSTIRGFLRPTAVGVQTESASKRIYLYYSATATAPNDLSFSIERDGAPVTQLLSSGLVFKNTSGTVTATYNADRANNIVKVAGTATSVASSTSGATTIASASLGVGLWIVTLKTELNTGGLKDFSMLTLGASTADSGQQIDSTTYKFSYPSVATSRYHDSITFALNNSSTMTLYLNVRQDSGSAKTITGYITAVKVA